MSNLIGHNAYRILGLDSSVNQKEILKRYKEIINRLKIDDYPKYDLDVNLPDKFRTEESVNDALKRLQNVKNNLIEYFFWFDIADTVDENALNYLQYDDTTSYDQAILIWKNASETENSTGLFYKKNLAVLYCLMLLKQKKAIMEKLEPRTSLLREVLPDKPIENYARWTSPSDNSSKESIQQEAEPEKTIINKELKEKEYDINEENNVYLKESLTNWKEIVDSDKFWITFEKRYGMNNDQVINADVIRDFRENIIKYISDIYYDLYSQYKNTKYVKDFQDVFGTIGEKTEKNLLKPIHQSIYDTIEKLDKIDLDEDDDSNEGKAGKIDYECDNCGKISIKLSTTSFDYDDGSILCEECHKIMGKEWQKKIDSEKTVEGSSKKIRQIQKVIIELESQLDQLHDIGLYENDQSKVVRDHVAEAITRASVMIHNKAFMRTKSMELLDLAIKFSGTKSMKDELESDLNKLRESIVDREQNTFGFKMGGFLRKKDLTVKDDFIEYNRTKIYYKDVISVSYYLKDADFTFSVISSKDKIILKFNERSHWEKVVNHAVPIIVPLVVDKLVKLIFEKDQTISIEKIKFDKKGFHHSIFLRGIESVLWDDRVYPAELREGDAVLYKIKNNIVKEFAFVSMASPNAVIIPELVKTCFNEYHMHNQT